MKRPLTLVAGIIGTVVSAIMSVLFAIAMVAVLRITATVVIDADHILDI